MNIIYWINSILSILGIVTTFVGLWAAGRLLPALITWLQGENCAGLLARSFVKVLFWLALGYIFTLPLMDGVHFLGNLVTAVAPQEVGEFSTILGTVTGRVYASFPLILMLVIYGIILYLAKNYLSTPGRFDQTERIFIVLSIASLAYRGVDNVFSQIDAFQFPIINVMQNYGVIGFLVEIVVGIVILTVILIGLNIFLPNHPASRE